MAKSKRVATARNREAGPDYAASPQPSSLERRRNVPSKKGARWGVILAGGDGVRLQPLTQFICGDERPKQFCPLFGRRTLLEQTLRRSEVSIPRERLIVSLTEHHAKWYSEENRLQPSQRVVQPANKGTAPPILHSILSIARLDEQALVAILPCDHYYADEQSFTFALEYAFETAAANTGSVILLGAKPDYPEVEYGWIELGSQLEHERSELFRVKSFREKPGIDVARVLLEQGSVWNTFVMVGHVQAFLQIGQSSVPELLSLLGSASLWSGEEIHLERSIYGRVPLTSFSHHVLSVEARRLAVLRLHSVGWSDLGDPGRAVTAVSESGCEAEWMHRWRTSRAVASAGLAASAAVA